MQEIATSEPTAPHNRKAHLSHNVRAVLYPIGTLLLFVFAISLMVSALSNTGPALADLISLATSNPFNGLFIGLMITAVLQSSSTTTSLLVAFAASGAITVTAATPIIMGANIGTTITSTIVSLGFINRKKEFRRAVAAGTYHDFFNILTATVLFPLEYYYQFVSGTSTWLANKIFVNGTQSQSASGVSFGMRAVTNWINEMIPNAFVLLLISVILLFSSILLFRRVVANLLKVRQPQAVTRFFFQNPLKSFAWGTVLTGAIRSSTITTSLVVPIVAKNFASLERAAPFILGANLGTTVTAFIAMLLYPHSEQALIIALIHLTFNVLGILIFFPIPFLRRIPLIMANALGKLTMRYRIAGFIYIITTFFIIPFLLIAFHKNFGKSGIKSAVEHPVEVPANSHD